MIELSNPLGSGTKNRTHCGTRQANYPNSALAE
jgi:hypothetical protein